MPHKITKQLALSVLASVFIGLSANAASITSENVMSQPNLPANRVTPVIGVLTEVLRDYKRFSEERQLFIASSYVKWLESAGAQVLPIQLNQDDDYYERIFNQTDGLLFPGGDNLLDPKRNTPMMVAARKLYSLAVAANDRGKTYPIWGTCLGMELLSVLSSNKNVLEECYAVDVVLPMEFAQRGKLFDPSNHAPFSGPGQVDSIVEALSRGNLTYNYHHKCLTDAGLSRAGLTNFYRPLTYSYDSNSFKFIATFEAINYPFFGSQFHPEKPPYEFLIRKSQKNIPHSREAIAISRYFADFFVTTAQMGSHRRTQDESIQDSLIYSHTPLYTAPFNDLYEQRYLFPYTSNRSGVDEGEFMDYLPDDDEEAPEEVTDDDSRIIFLSITR